MYTAPAAQSLCSADLAWGRRYAVVRPTHYRVAYAINPYMDPANQPDPRRAMRQWVLLIATLRSVGAEVEVIEQRPDAPDMVYAMNLGLPFNGRGGPGVVLSHMRFPQRRVETTSARDWFEDAGFVQAAVGRDGAGPHWESGDAFPFAGELVVGYGMRTEEPALARLAAGLDVRVLGVRLVHPAMYHLDLAFCPLDSSTALVYPAAFDEAGAAALLSLVPDPLVLTAAEAFSFCANSVVIGRSIVMPACSARLRRELERREFAVRVVDVSEFHKGGGSVRCLTNPLDLVIGRDLTLVPGGDLILT
jgi:N-dimethylarginine dimethylaminohydrolase